MISIGIENHSGLVYEGDSQFGRGVWPAPVITCAKFILPNEDIKAEASSNIFGYRFREDSFDPIARIRRGRFYLADQSQPQTWRVMRHPGWPFDSIAPDIHGMSKSLNTFRGNPIPYKYTDSKHELPLVLLGVESRFTVWTIISVEAISTGEDLVTLKARSSFGILPHIKTNEIPEALKAKLDESLSSFADEVHRASPVSIIDRARDVITYALMGFLNLSGEKAQDLGQLIKKLEPKEMAIASSAATIIARLHARAKPTEQEKRKLKPIREQDAELAIQCVNVLLCEIGFAD